MPRANKNSGSLRALLIGPYFRTTEVGGLQLALDTLVAQLTARGWQMDAAIYDPRPTPPSLPKQPNKPGTSYVTSRFEALRGSIVFMRLWERVPVSPRRYVVEQFMSHGFWKDCSNSLAMMGRLLADPTQYDLVLAAVDGAPPGFASFVLHKHPRVVLLSLAGLARDLQDHWRPLTRRVARFRLNGHAHPFLLASTPIDKIQRVIFASKEWERAAVAQGLPPDLARTIYYSIPLPEPLPRREGNGKRLLWLGRLSPEKGLHLILPALPRVREELPGVTLPVIASKPKVNARMVQDGVTCLCYEPNTPASLVAAVVRMLRKNALRARLVENGKQLMRQEFAVERMGERFDWELRSFLFDPPIP